MNRAKLDINSSEFESNEFFLNLLKNYNLKQLVDKNLNIQSEIKSFDHDIQSMVSDNYSKFISSIDIVKKMKESIEGVEKKMEKLETSVNKINDLAVKVDSTLETKRTEIKKLDMINKDLSGLRKLWEFPDLLKKELNQYKKTIGEILKEYNKGTMSPLHFPKEILSKMNLRSLFRESAEYYLDCKEKLEKYKTEKLIEPLFKESQIYISEIKTILDALVFNKQNSGDEHRMILYNYLCFQSERVPTIKAFYRNLGDHYTTVLRKLFSSLDKVGGKLNQREYQIELDEDNPISVNVGRIVKDAIGVMVEMNSNKKEFSVYDQFKKIKETVQTLFTAELNSCNSFDEIDTIMNMLKSDIQFVISKLNVIVDGESQKSLQENFTRLLRTIFSEISRKLSILKPPYLLHIIVFKKFQEQFLSIVHIAKNSFYEPILECLLQRMELEVIWISQLSNLMEIIGSFTHAQAKSLKMYLKTKVNIEKLEKGDSQIFELNFDREMSHIAKVVTQTILLSSMSYLHDLRSISQRAGEHIWEDKIDAMCGDYWNLVKSLLITYGQDLNEEQIIDCPKRLLVAIEHVLGDETISKSKILTVVKSKVYENFVEEINKLKAVKSSVFTVVLLTKIFAEIKSSSFTGPLYDSYASKAGLLQRIFSSFFKSFDSEDISIVKKFTNEVKSSLGEQLKVYLTEITSKKQGGQVQTVSREIEPLLVELKLVIGTIFMMFDEELRQLNSNKDQVFKSDSNTETNILLARQSKIFEHLTSSIQYSPEMYLVATSKSVMRTVLRLLRSKRFSACHATQIQADMSLLSEILNESMPKDDDSNLQGFYFECINSLGRQIYDFKGENWKISENLLLALCKGKRQSLSYLSEPTH